MNIKNAYVSLDRGALHLMRINRHNVLIRFSQEES